MDKNKMIGVDLTKNISQLNITTMTGGLLSKKKLSRDRFKEFMKAHEPAIVVLERAVAPTIGPRRLAIWVMM